MKFKLLLLGVLLSFTIKAQQVRKIYYDNRNNSVVEYFRKSKVLPMLSENNMSGFSTVMVRVSKAGKIVSITDLLNSNNVFFLVAKDAINSSDGKWVIKPGINNQTFQITFYMISGKKDSLRRSGRLVVDLQKPFGLNIDYNSEPIEVTLLPTVKIVYKEANLPIQRVE
jgi:hypothetical protein